MKKIDDPLQNDFGTLSQKTGLKELGGKSLAVVRIYNLTSHQLLTSFLTGFSEIGISADLLVQLSSILDPRP